MKKITLLLVLLISSIAFSQDVVKKIADETCDCIKKKKFDYETVSTDELQSALGVCMMGSYTKHEKELKGDDKIELSDSEGLKKFGEKVALKMLNSCPDVIIALGKSSLNDETEDEMLEDEADPFLEGEVVAFKSEQFVTIQVKDANARIHNFLLLTDFDSASLYTNGEIKVKDKIKVTYSEYELYDAKNKEFKYYNVISGLEKI